MRIPRACLAFACMAFWASDGLADDVVVLSAAAVKTSVAGLPEMSEASNRDHVEFRFGTAGAIRDRAFHGDAFDLVILPPGAMGELEKQALLAPGSQTPLGTVRLGAGVRKGAPLPDLNNVDAFKQALLSAPSVAIADPARGATTGIYLVRLFDSLGVADGLKSKLRLYPDGQNAMEAVARGEVSMALGQISEGIKVDGLAALTPLPEAVQLKTTYVAALANHASHPEAAARLLALLRGAAMRELFKANGF